MKETKTLEILSESILVYTPSGPMTKRAFANTYETLQKVACKALACTPERLPIGIIILKPGDKLSVIPSITLLAQINKRLANIEEKVGK